MIRGTVRDSTKQTHRTGNTALQKQMSTIPLYVWLFRSVLLARHRTDFYVLVFFQNWYLPVGTLSGVMTLDDQSLDRTFQSVSRIRDLFKIGPSLGVARIRRNGMYSQLARNDNLQSAENFLKTTSQSILFFLLWINRSLDSRRTTKRRNTERGGGRRSRNSPMEEHRGKPAKRSRSFRRSSN